MRDTFKRKSAALARSAGRFLLAGGLGLVVPAVAFASPMTFTVTGTGSQSQGMSGVSGSPFWWIDATGGVTGASVSPYGFDLYAGQGVTGIPDPWTGSLLTSSAFTLADGETLNVAMSLLSRRSDDYYSLGFAVLLEDSTIKAVLANVRPDGIEHFGDLPNPPDVNFTRPGPTVAYSQNSGPMDDGFALGGSQYGQQSLIGSCLVRTCETSILSSITPGAGTYQLLFGTFGIGSGSALAVTSITTSADTSVPEPGTLALLAIPVALGFARRRGWRRA